MDQLEESAGKEGDRSSRLAIRRRPVPPVVVGTLSSECRGPRLQLEPTEIRRSPLPHAGQIRLAIGQSWSAPFRRIGAIEVRRDDRAWILSERSKRHRVLDVNVHRQRLSRGYDESGATKRFHRRDVDRDLVGPRGRLDDVDAIRSVLGVDGRPRRLAVRVHEGDRERSTLRIHDRHANRARCALRRLPVSPRTTRSGHHHED